MATARARRGKTPARAKPGGVVGALQWLWAAVLSLAFIVVGLALAGGGLIFAVVGVQGALNPDDAGHVIAGVLFVLIGAVGMAGGALTVFWLLPRGVKKLSGRKPPSLGGGSGGFYGGYFGGGDGGGCGGGDGGGGGGGGSC